jgi:hypothetical protein
MSVYKNTKEFRAAQKALISSMLDLERQVQELAIFAIRMALKGDLSYANLLIRSRIKDQQIEWAGLLISWFEKFGKVKWSIKKHRLVNSVSGRWAIDVAVKSPWSESKELADDLLDAILDYENHNIKQSNLIYEEKVQENKSVSSAIQKYLASHPVSDNPIGKLGLPADKNQNRWGRYKLKIKHK